MKYPINTETYIAALRLELGHNEAAERALRKIIPLVNDCYTAGAAGKPCPIHEHMEEVAAFRKRTKGRAEPNNVCSRLIQWCYEAYGQGRQDAGKGAVHHVHG